MNDDILKPKTANETTVTDAEIVDADMVADATEMVASDIDSMTLENTERGEGDAMSLPAIEGIIKRKVSQINELKEKTTQLREMVDDVLLNDDEYNAAAEKVKEATKEKSAARTKLMAQDAARTAADKLKDAKEEMKDLMQGLSANLREYERLAGTNQIELDDGDLRQIIMNAKLVKRAQQ